MNYFITHFFMNIDCRWPQCGCQYPGNSPRLRNKPERSVWTWDRADDRAARFLRL